MSEWSLSQLLAGLHDDIEQRWRSPASRSGIPEPRVMPARMSGWNCCKCIFPQRYQAANAHVVDSLGVFSDQIDVVIFDRQYSPFIFNFQGQTIIPAESVYGVFEAKQTINADQLPMRSEKSQASGAFTARACQFRTRAELTPRNAGPYPGRPANA